MGITNNCNLLRGCYLPWVTSIRAQCNQRTETRRDPEVRQGTLITYITLGPLGKKQTTPGCFLVALAHTWQTPGAYSLFHAGMSAAKHHYPSLC